jgi:cytochrome b pre-mRNA-processing protein 3
VKPLFRTRHAVLMTHIWMVHKRLLLSDIQNGKLVQEALFDYLWEDTTNRIRNQKINELSVNKNLKDVQSFSFRYCIELDQSLKMPTEDEILEDIGGAIWRSVYDRAEDVSEKHVMDFAR